MNGERGGAGHDSHCFRLQRIADVFCSFVADLIPGQVEFCYCLHEKDDDESSVREIGLFGSRDE